MVLVLLLIPLGADAWRTRLAGGGATHLSSHARHPRPATSDKTEGSQALTRPTASKRVSSPPVGTIPSMPDVTDDPHHNSKPLSGSERRGLYCLAPIVRNGRAAGPRDAVPPSSNAARLASFG